MSSNNYYLSNSDSKETFFDIIRNFDREKIIVVTDPPFNIGYKYRTYKDKMEEDDYYEMLGFFLQDFPSVVIHYPENLYKVSFQIGKFPEKVISWVYNSNTQKQHRDIAFFGVKPDMSKVTQPYKNPTDKRVKQLIASGKTGAKLYDWWNINQVKNISREKTAHPCQMPLEVMENVIGILPDDAVIVDPFAGASTTGVAVLKMNKKQKTSRTFVGIEIDKEYFNIGLKRLKETEEQ